QRPSQCLSRLFVVMGSLSWERPDIQHIPGASNPNLTQPGDLQLTGGLVHLGQITPVHNFNPLPLVEGPTTPPRRHPRTDRAIPRMRSTAVQTEPGSCCGSQSRTGHHRPELVDSCS